MAKRTPKLDDPAQSKRFIEAAQELETDDSPEEFERVFDKLAPSRNAGEVQHPKSEKAG